MGDHIRENSDDGKVKMHVYTAEGSEGDDTAHAYDQNPDTTYSVSGDKVFFRATSSNFITIDAVRLRTSNKFVEAVMVENAEVKIGDEVCGYLPNEVDEATWYKVTCNNSVTTKSGEISRAQALSFSEIEFLL